VTKAIWALIDQVWARLADFGAIADWNVGVEKSYVTSTKGKGCVDCHHYDVGGSNYLDEEVMTFIGKQAMMSHRTDTNLPIYLTVIRFPVLFNNLTSTLVTCSPLFKLKVGCMGEVLNFLMVRNRNRAGMNKFIAGLKEDIEGKQKQWSI
jgi:hypothetical protein